MAMNGHPDIKFGKIGILIINLGTPEGTDTKSIRTYLSEFLKDRRVIEWPRLLWYPILYGIVLNTRPKKVGKAYEAIWNQEQNESFLRTYTRSQSEKLAEIFSNHQDVIVDWAMRYGKPTLEERLNHLQAQGCERILVFPLYPQYAAATTATVNDQVFRALMKMRWQPAIRSVPAYYDKDVYIEALAQSVEQHLATLTWEPEILVTSFHGIPQSYFQKGDPYYCQCQKTARLLRERLGLPKEKLIVTFQSRFGPEEWLQPYTDKTIAKLATEGVKRIAVINPGFVADCLETLEEIGEEAAEDFLSHGGENFTHIPCLNDTDAGINVLEKVIRREVSGWVETNNQSR